MAAKTTDIAKKKKQQTIMLVVGGVLFAGLLMFQLPKLMGGGSDSAAPTPVSADTPVATGASATPSAVVVTAKPTKSSAVLAGVVISPAQGVEPEQGDLRSLSLFETKDPFEPQISLEDQQPPGGAADSNPKNNAPPAGTGSGSGAKSGDGTSAPNVPAEDPTNATIMFNGKPQLVEVKGVFPKPDALFVLKSLKPKSAQIKVNGGSFSDGQTLTLKLGKRVTLVNTATGARYVLKLVYTGSQPEEIENFAPEAEETEEADGE